MKRSPGTLTLGQLAGGRSQLALDRKSRRYHLYVVGATGSGKSKFVEHLIRQDIYNQPRTGSGLLLLDPHGRLYDDLACWLASFHYERPIVFLDPKRDDRVVAYNLLRRRRQGETSVVIGNLVSAMAHVWGAGGTDQTPQFAKFADAVLQVLLEKDFTLNDALYLTDPGNRELRASITENLNDPVAQQTWRSANQLTKVQFEDRVASTVNRLQRFLKNERFRLMFAHTDVSIDLAAALDEGWIILVNLSTKDGKLSREDAHTFGTLLLTDLWTAAANRGKGGDGKEPTPFYVYIDEFQDFLTPTIAESLDQARGFGLHFTLAHQYPGQILDDPRPYAKRLFGSVMTNTRNKAVFGGIPEEWLIPLVNWLFMGVFDPDKIKHELYSTKVLQYRLESHETKSWSHATGVASGSSVSTTAGSGFSHPAYHFVEPTFSQSETQGRATQDSWSEMNVETTNQTLMLIPELGQERSNVQFESLEEQRYRAMATLFDQQQQQFVFRNLTMREPVSVVTPWVRDGLRTKNASDSYIAKVLARWPFVLDMHAARQRLEHQRAFLEGRPLSSMSEPDDYWPDAIEGSVVQ